MEYVSRNAHYPVGWEKPKTGGIVVVVSAIIDAEGKVNNAFVSSPFHPAFDQIALKLMVSSPQWLPAIEHHRKVNTEVRMPIAFTQTE